MPALGPACADALPPPGETVDPQRLVSCLRPALEGIVNSVLGEAVPPNIVLILTDDQRWDTLGVMPNVMEKIANHGIYFTNGFVSTPICGPSRASLLTGLYSHNTGVSSNDVLEFDDSSTLATWLNDRGYETGLFGKYMNNYEALSPYIPPGWDQWNVFLETDHRFYDYTLNENGQLHGYGNDEADYSTDVLRDLVVDFIRKSADQPFLAVYAPAAPHVPEIPALRHIGTFANLPPWRPPSWNEPDISEKPAWVKFLRALSDPDKEDARDQRRRNQLEMLLAVDEAVEAIIDTVESLNLQDNTIIVFTSDHGLGWGEHWWHNKEAAYEEAIRVPLVMRYPLLAPLPRSEDGSVQNVDLAPTLAELAGASVPAGLNGTSLLGLIEGSAVGRQDLLLEYGGGLFIPGYTAIRTDQWKYIRNQDPASFEELYDLVNDPYEMQNLAGDGAYAGMIQTLTDRLGELLAE